VKQKGCYKFARCHLQAAVISWGSIVFFVLPGHCLGGSGSLEWLFLLCVLDCKILRVGSLVLLVGLCLAALVFVLCRHQAGVTLLYKSC
jgi:hypothetical protein